MKSYKRMKKADIDISKRKIIRDKIWNHLKDCWLWQELGDGKFERIPEGELKNIADELVDIILE